MDAEKSNKNQGFSLKGRDEAFSARENSVFGNLPIIELAQNNEHLILSEAPTSDISDDRSDVNLYKGEESIFKQPMPKLKKPTLRPRKQSYPNRMQRKLPNIPNHQRNPEKWVKYSLASTSDITDQSNTAAAFSFLKEIEERKRKLEPEEPEADLSGKIVFKKPKSREEKSHNNKSFRDGKLCMPAFEFGSKKSKLSKSKTGNDEVGSSRPSLQRALSHLNDDEEEEGAEG